MARGFVRTRQITTVLIIKNGVDIYDAQNSAFCRQTKFREPGRCVYRKNTT